MGWFLYKDLRHESVNGLSLISKHYNISFIIKILSIYFITIFHNATVWILVIIQYLLYSDAKE